MIETDRNQNAVNSDDWSPGPSNPALPDGEVHVWRLTVEAASPALRQLESVLSEDERTRAGRFRFERDRNCYVAARGSLRRLLGSYLGQSPEDVCFGYTAYEKPYLHANTSGSPLHFNASHSHGLILLAFSRAGEIGVDVEMIRREFSGDEIAQRYFSARELAELRRLPADLHARAFFLCWTRKEAYIKARGAGMQIPLDSFSVSLTPGAAVSLESEDQGAWTLHSIEPGRGYAGAAVVRRNDSRLRLYDLQV